VAVMYAGRIVEFAPVHDLFAKTRHPYTLGLLNSVPRLDEKLQEKLIPIKGLPPDLINAMPGCAFRPRCAHVTEACLIRPPKLQSVGRNHSVACWVDMKKL